MEKKSYESERALYRNLARRFKLALASPLSLRLKGEDARSKREKTLAELDAIMGGRR